MKIYEIIVVEKVFLTPLSSDQFRPKYQINPNHYNPNSTSNTLKNNTPIKMHDGPNKIS